MTGTCFFDGTVVGSGGSRIFMRRTAPASPRCVQGVSKRGIKGFRKGMRFVLTIGAQVETPLQVCISRFSTELSYVQVAGLVCLIQTC